MKYFCLFFPSQTSFLILQFSQNAWLGFLNDNCHNSFAATRNRTNISRVAPNSRDLLKGALPTELHGRGFNYEINVYKQGCFLKLKSLHFHSQIGHLM